jgi:hypothetical protein
VAIVLRRYVAFLVLISSNLHASTVTVASSDVEVAITPLNKSTIPGFGTSHV